MDASRLVDRFSCYSPSVSLDGQYIAFTKFFAPHGVPSPDDHTMLYLVARSASENRPSRVSENDDINVGFPLYPAGIGNRPTDNVDVSPAEAHVLVSYYIWQDANEFFFADNRAGQLAVVWVVMRDNAAVVRDRVVATSQIEMLKQHLTRQGFLSIKMQGDSVEVVLNSNAKHPVVIGLNLNDFRAVGSVNLARKPDGS